VNGRSKFRKLSGHDQFWQNLKARVEDPPLPPRFAIYDFVPIAANGILAYFNVVDTRTNFTIGRCCWRDRPTEHVELPCGVAVRDPNFHPALLTAIRKHVYNQYLKGEVKNE
jgi:hypothetical protein